MPTSDPDHKIGQGEWQEIETAPKDGTLIMVCWAGSVVAPIISRWLKNAEAWTTPYSVKTYPPTHWMPLPSPPSREPEPPVEERER